MEATIYSDKYLAAIAACIRRTGWISKKAAESMFPEPKTTAIQAWREPSFDARDLELAQAALNWAGRSVEVVTEEKINELAALIPAYQQHMEPLAEKLLDEHVGVVGDRTGFTVTVKSIRSFDSQNGERVSVLFRDLHGRLLSWFTSRPGKWLEEGKTYDITGTVKEHGSHNGYKQTALHRVVPGLPKPKKVAA